MKKFLVLCALMAAPIAFCLAAQQAPSSSQVGDQAEGKALPQQKDIALTMEGEITRLDDKLKQFWLQMPDGREMPFTFAPDILITDPAHPSTQGLSAAKLKPRMHLKVEYDNVNGSHVASKIEIRPVEG